MNKVIIIGRLVADVELNNYGKGKNAGVYTHFTVAVNDGKDEKGESKAVFIPCSAFNHSAEILDEYVKKGDMVAITGRIAIDSYEDKEGNKRSKFYLNVENVELLPNGKKK